jgi:hypothetical protein
MPYFYGLRRGISQRPFLAEDCLRSEYFEGLFTKKLPPRLDKSAAIYDPLQSLKIRDILAL